MIVIKKETLKHTAVILLSMAIIVVGYLTFGLEKTDEDTFSTYQARVITITDRQIEELFLGDVSIINLSIYFDAEIIGGEKKGNIVSAVQYIEGMEAVSQPEIEAGARVILFSTVERDASQPSYIFIEYNRTNTIIILALLFFGFLLLLGRYQGFRTIVSLLFTLCAIFLVFVPAILKGYNIYIASMVLCFYIIPMSLLIINGINKKSLCAIIGNFGGLILAGILALIFSRISHLTGMTSEDTMHLKRISTTADIDLVAIIWSGIVIGTLGAVMDVAMSVSTAMHELSVHMKVKRYKVLLKSGLQVGADVLGTMTNTLILAYVGSSLALLMVVITYYTDLLLLFNSEMMVVEIMQALIGSMGILAAIPVTSIVAARIYSHITPIGGRKHKKYWQRKLNDRSNNF